MSRQKVENVFMKNFKVIEEGRLSKTELSELIGGVYTCSMNSYSTKDNCQPSTPSYSQCSGYVSCSDSNPSSKMSCNGYTGPTGPGGII